MLEIALSLLGNRFIQLAVIFVVGWLYGWSSTSHSWRTYVAEEKAKVEYAAQVERARQETAARELAAEATQRLSDEQAATAEMQKQIEAMRKDDEKSPCVLSDVDIGRVRRLDAAGRTRRPASRTR